VPAQAGDLQVRAVGQISRPPRAVGGLKRTAGDGARRALPEPRGAATGGASRSGPPRASGVGGARQITRRWTEAARQWAQLAPPTEGDQQPHRKLKDAEIRASHGGGEPSRAMQRNAAAAAAGLSPSAASPSSSLGSPGPTPLSACLPA